MVTAQLEEIRWVKNQRVKGQISKTKGPWPLKNEKICDQNEKILWKKNLKICDWNEKKIWVKNVFFCEKKKFVNKIKFFLWKNENFCVEKGFFFVKNMNFFRKKLIFLKIGMTLLFTTH